MYTLSAERRAALQAGDLASLFAATRAEFGGFVMVQTDSTSVIIPEVWGDMAQAEFLGAVKVLTSGAVVYDNTLEGQPGESISFPKWMALTELQDLTEGTPLVPEKMDSSSAQATIKEAGKAVEITDRSKLVGLGDPEAEARRQFGVLSARKLDRDLITAAAADETAQGGGNPLRYTTAAGKTTFTYLDAIVPAVAQFGDEWDPALFAGLFIHSQQFAQVIADPQFIDQAKLGATTPVLSGQLGVLAGVPVAITDRLTAGQYMMLKRNSLGALYKRRPLVESDRDILARSTVVTTTQHYAVKRLTDRGVLIGTLAAV